MRYALAVAGLAAAATAGKVTLTATEEVTITSCAPTHTACPYKNQHNEWEDWSEDPADSETTGAAHSWGSWDPASSAAASSWASWDPKSPAASTATGSWAAWDPKNTAKSTATGTWATWDPKNTGAAASTWASWDPKNTGAAASSTWATWDPAADASSTWATWDPKKTAAPTTTATATWNTWEGANGASSSASCPQYTATAPPAWFSQLPSSVLSSLAAKWTGAPPSDWCYYSYSNGVVTQTKTPDAASASSTWASWNADATNASGTGVKGVSATNSGPIAKYTGAASANAASFVLAGAAAVAAVVLA